MKTAELNRRLMGLRDQTRRTQPSLDSVIRSGNIAEAAKEGVMLHWLNCGVVCLQGLRELNYAGYPGLDWSNAARHLYRGLTSITTAVVSAIVFIPWASGDPASEAIQYRRNR